MWDDVPQFVTATRFWNVSGYPEGLKKEYLPLLSKNIQTTIEYIAEIKKQIRFDDPHMFKVLENLQMRLQLLDPDLVWSSFNDSQFLLLYSFSSYILSFANINTVNGVASELHTFNMLFNVLGEHTFMTDYCNTESMLKNSRISLNSDQSYLQMKRIIGGYEFTR